MHYFIDHEKLTQQTIADSYGPEQGNETVKYKITSQFQLTAPAKAFALVKSMMIIQQSSANNNLVNIILSPFGIGDTILPIKYVVYRGIKKESFFTTNNGADVIMPQSTGNNEFIKKFWEDFEKWKISTNQPNAEPPTPHYFGYDNSISGTELIDSIYRNKFEARAYPVAEGTWIGDFTEQNKIGIDIILSGKEFEPDLNYLRAEKYNSDLSGISNEFDSRAKKEEIYNFLDPAAFFGYHYSYGVNITIYSGTEKLIKKLSKKELQIFYDSLIKKFASRNKIYLDIRNETGYSYNFYKNYDDGFNHSIRIGNSEIPLINSAYETHGWPIITIDSSINTVKDKNDVKICLRVDDNINPFLFLNNTPVDISSLDKRYFYEKRILPDTYTGWTKELSFEFPNIPDGSAKLNIANYIELDYFRRLDINTIWPDNVFKIDNYTDGVFGPIDKNGLVDDENTFQQVHFNETQFIEGMYPDSLDQFGYIATGGVFFDENSVVFHSSTWKHFKNTQNFLSRDVQPGTGIKFNGNANKLSFLTKDIQITTQTILEDIGNNQYEAIKLLTISAYNSLFASKEAIMLLGITRTEFEALKQTQGLSQNHHRFIKFIEITPPGPQSYFTDIDGKRYKKYSLKVHGLDDQANYYEADPQTEIIVYSNDGFVFTSKTFVAAQATTVATEYTRNYEEGIGYNYTEDVTKKKYEDHFIDSDNVIKTIVDSFISELDTINFNPDDPIITQENANVYSRLKTLVETKAKDLWDTAVSNVQAGTLDDRPLYWARNKMEVALKSHPYFNGQYDKYSNVLKGSDLEYFIRIFEEKSRNYTGVDFSYATQNNLKKVLITGFDPFQLANNKKQSNPSGVCALALHEKTLGNGYIQAMVTPVRYRDFDGSNDRSKGKGDGIVEKYITPFIGRNENQADIIITISQSGAGNYNIDRFATINRGGGDDNLASKRELNSDSVILIKLSERDLIWIETTLPKAMVMDGGASQQPDSWKHYVVYAQHYSLVNDEISAIPKSPMYDLPWDSQFDNFKPDNPEQIFTTIKKPDNLFDINNKKKRIIRGSGGNYLSNEIFYRVALARERWQRANPSESKFSAGHFHVAYIQETGKDLTDKYFKSSRTIIDEMSKLIQTVQERITIGVNNLNDLF